MFSRILTDRIRVELSIPQFSEKIFALCDRNREHLRKWLYWVDGTKTSADTEEFLKLQLQGFSRLESLSVTIFYDGAIAGVAGFISLDKKNGKGVIGYWLGKEFTGNGIMTAVVRDLIEIGREYYSLQRIQIDCATENHASRAIPERLGFTHEGTLRRELKEYDGWVDIEVYGLLLEEG